MFFKTSQRVLLKTYLMLICIENDKKITHILSDYSKKVKLVVHPGQTPRKKIRGRHFAISVPAFQYVGIM